MTTQAIEQAGQPEAAAARAPQTALAALTAAALALPGLAQAQIQTDYLYAHYREGDLAADQVQAGQTRERYQIDTHQFKLALPLADEQAMTAAITYETMSGASPWWVQPDINGKPVLVMSRASIREQRVDTQFSYLRALAGIDWTATLGYSHENDYDALSGGLQAEFTPEGSALTYSAGLGYSYDRLNPTVGASSTDVIDKADKDSLSLFAGSTWTINPQTLLQTAVSYGRDHGYLSDPYKRAYIVDLSDAIRDARPGKRNGLALSARLRHYLPTLAAALHVNYRYYADDWKVSSHTLELAWHQVLAQSWRLSPSVRWYSQSQATFYAPYYQNLRADGYASSDYRLAPYGAVTLGIDLRKALPQDWEAGGGVQWYQARADYALGNVRLAHPGLLEYWLLNLRLSKRF
ncbi:DUF3570 domain-containing protein [Sinimarinibacterium sp. NLF-5-8]|uniref:DUF3570 domain-containing protein n=1 Tax=Sinimarinibacterium sp. NLF-5-8 TaxID=2698684 RepID=UPI00137C177C|nr:DUF3570 domain-containing protein [Sinimarinibacterium sp. NLF-5-8]QHS10806.1 DUF3570 domain-containing protein [Sinimarinibacterium sp. NLF-5-8]